jgi:hypothetical protein
MKVEHHWSHYLLIGSQSLKILKSILTSHLLMAFNIGRYFREIMDELFLHNKNIRRRLFHKKSFFPTSAKTIFLIVVSILALSSFFSIAYAQIIPPTSHVHAEPAPMGISDYGMSPSTGTAVTPYSTTSFLGTINIQSYSPNSQTSGVFQLNVNFDMETNGKPQVYWIQLVATISQTAGAYYLNNFAVEIWNYTSPGDGKFSSNCIQGPGGVSTASSRGAQTFGNTLSTSDPISFPTNLDFKVESAMAASTGQPEIIAMYQDADHSGWTTVDTAIFTCYTPESDSNLVVEGNSFDPNNNANIGIVSYSDAELDFGFFSSPSPFITLSRNDESSARILERK